MPEAVVFERLGKDIFNYKGTCAYAYLENYEETSIDGGRIIREGGCLAFVRYKTAGCERYLSSFLSCISRSPLMFIDNRGLNTRHWNKACWGLSGGRMANTGVCSFGSLRLVAAQGSGAEQCGEGFRFQKLRLMYRGQEIPVDAMLSWDGCFCFALPVERLFSLENYITYYTDGFDEVTQRNIYVETCVGGPRLRSCPSDSQASSRLSFDSEGPRAFDLPPLVEMEIDGFPELESEELSFVMTPGVAGSRLECCGTARACKDGVVRMGERGCFPVMRGDRISFALSSEGSSIISHCGLPTVRVKIASPFTASGFEVDTREAVPVMAAAGTHAYTHVGRLLAHLLEECASAPAYSPGASLSGGMFGSCLYRGHMLWYRFGPSDEDGPGLSMCRLSIRLALALAAEDAFLCLDAESAGRHFTMPFTVDAESLAQAAERGCPQGDINALRRCFPSGQVFLSTSEFDGAMDRAGVRERLLLREACSHYRLKLDGCIFSFQLENWGRDSTLLILKASRLLRLCSYIGALQSISLAPADTERARGLLMKVWEASRDTVLEEVFEDCAWRGALLLNAVDKISGKRAALAFFAESGVIKHLILDM